MLSFQTRIFNDLESKRIEHEWLRVIPSPGKKPLKMKIFVPETLDQVLKDENLQAFMEPQLEILEMEPVSFKAVVPLEPVVDLGDIASIQLERQPVEVTDEQVDELVERLRYDSAPWEPADRPVKFGDLLTGLTGLHIVFTTHGTRLWRKMQGVGEQEILEDLENSVCGACADDTDIHDLKIISYRKSP